MTLDCRRCTDEALWERLATQSPQGCIFCRKAFLDLLEVPYDRWTVSRDGRLELGAVALHGGERFFRRPYAYSQYQGVLLDPGLAELAPHSRVGRVLEATEVLLEAMTAETDSLTFSLHHSLRDVRAFQWFRYHQSLQDRFVLDVRMAGVLDLTAYRDMEEYLTRVRSLRRREWQRAQKQDCRIEESTDVDGLDELNGSSYQRQQAGRTDIARRLLKTIAPAALRDGFGRLVLARDREGRALAANFFLHDQRCGYYLIGGNTDEARRCGAGTLLMIDQIRWCMERGLRAVDFVGINSPQRGDYKISFNAEPLPYFVASWRRPTAGTGMRHDDG